MLLSTFELLLKSITPNPGTVSGSNRSILQGYFLNVSNPNATNLRIRLRFTATTPGINPAQLLDVVDTTGTNDFSGVLVADGPNRFRYDFTLNANDTGLFILQPNILTLNPATAQVEVRGYVEIFIVVPFFGPSRPLLVTPEHRGTFLPSPGDTPGEFDQLIVSLPTSTGAGLLTVDTVRTFPDIVFEPQPPVTLPNPVPPLMPIATATDLASNGDQSQITLEQVLNVMAQRIDSLEMSRVGANQN